jgi:High potential iron-sulfur protein
MDALTRRSFFRLGLTMTAATTVAAALTSCSGKSATAASVCADPEAMSPSETSLRQANHYLERSSDAGKTCSGCSFFTASAEAKACGTCQIFTGGPANPQGHCDSWAAKAPAA